MKRWIKYMELWLGGILMLLLMAGCSSSSDDETGKPKVKPMLKIYLFAPDSPIITRASIGYVNASEAEKEIRTIDVWVFEHLYPNDKVSYIHLDNLSFTGQKEIAMEVSDEFADLPKKPNVDIYVIANKESCRLTALNGATTLAELKEVCIHNGSFGIEPLAMSVPEAGLPMSGFLENQMVSGIPPVYTAMAQNVKLVRAVSKIRFVFSKSTANPPEISNLGITLKENMLPKQEYIFLDDVYPDAKIRIKKTGNDDYEAQATLLSDVNGNSIEDCDNPASYTYTSETGQAYETKINDGITAGNLSEIGTFYFRESDKKLEGTISYTVGTTPKSVDFKMASEGDFTRNHTWIVYGYFLGSGELQLNVVDVKAWTDDTGDPKVYNW